jgi:hypothetical protein
MLPVFRRLWNWSRLGRGSAEELDEDEELRWLYPPENPEDAGAWDRYWTNQVSNGLGPALFDMFCHDHELIRIMNNEGMSRILCAGNGISQEPRGLAAAGFEVVALDLSPRALEIARTAELPTEDLEHFCNPAMLRPGGHVDFVVGDIRDSAVCPGPFDVIIERRTAQLYANRAIAALLNKLEERLDSNGILFSHCHDGAWKPPARRRHFTESWFEKNGWTIWSGDSENKPSGRVAWLFTSTG